jgi:hypothetical protein
LDTPDKGFFVSFRRIDQIEVSTIIDRLYRVQQSNSNFFINDRLRIRSCVAKVPGGNGMVGLLPGDDVEKFIQRKTSVIDLPSHTNLCLPLAIVVAVEMKTNPQNVVKINSSRFPRYKWLELENIARDLCQKCNIALPINQPFGYEELQLFQTHLLSSDNGAKKYRIIVFTDFEGDCVFRGLFTQ